jgi:hypothetical protein
MKTTYFDVSVVKLKHGGYLRLEPPFDGEGIDEIFTLNFYTPAHYWKAFPSLSEGVLMAWVNGEVFLKNYGLLKSMVFWANVYDFFKKIRFGDDILELIIKLENEFAYYELSPDTKQYELFALHGLAFSSNNLINFNFKIIDFFKNGEVLKFEEEIILDEIDISVLCSIGIVLDNIKEEKVDFQIKVMSPSFIYNKYKALMKENEVLFVEPHILVNKFNRLDIENYIKYKDKNNRNLFLSLFDGT